MAHEVARAIADGWPTPASQVRQHQFAYIARLDGLAATRIEYLRDELAFVDVYALLQRAGKAVSSHLRHASVIVGLRTPGIFDTLAGGRDRGSRFPGLNSHAAMR